jgi:hypothetical protein
MRLGLLFLLLGLCGGCVSAPTLQQQQDAYYGPEPKDYQEIVKNGMSALLKDPTSATYEFIMPPKKTWYGGGLSGPIQYGWGVCTSINAKNSFGGYTGSKLYFFLLRDGNFAAMEEDPTVLNPNICKL